MEIPSLIVFIIQALWFIAPAYAANAFPPIIKGKHPLDFNKNLLGQPILGKGKTFEGSLAGFFFGVLIGIAELYFQPLVEQYVPLIELTLPSVVLLSGGAIIGDIVASFFKRRAGIKRGEPVPLMDQLDFIVGALLFSSFVKRLPLPHFVFILLITPLVHLIANIIGYLFKIKKVPY